MFGRRGICGFLRGSRVLNAMCLNRILMRRVKKMVGTRWVREDGTRSLGIPDANFTDGEYVLVFLYVHTMYRPSSHPSHFLPTSASPLLSC